jgi:hypothetical protein
LGGSSVVVLLMDGEEVAWSEEETRRMRMASGC